MSTKHAHLVSAVIVVIISLFFLFFSIPIYSDRIGAGPGSGVFPFWISLVMALCGLAYFWQSLKLPTSIKFVILDIKQLPHFLKTTFSIIVYIVIMPYLGFALTSFLFLVFSLKVIGQYRIIFALIFSLIATILIVLCFKEWLYIALPRGLLGW